MRTVPIVRFRRSRIAQFARVAVLGGCLAASAAPAAETFVQKHGRLKVMGNKIVDKDGRATTLHGMSLYCWSEQGTRYFNAAAIDRLAGDWKCTVIRIPILPADYRRSSAREMAKVKKVVDACIAAGMYAIVDWHSMAGAQRDVESARAFFAAVATAYGKSPNIMYEPWNEPEQESWPVIKAYHEAVIAKIRPIDPEGIVICGCRHWDQECAEASKDPITSTRNVAYSVHFYAASHREPLRKDAAAALAHGVALFATEYGTSSYTGGGDYDPAETKVWWDWLDANGVGSANWSVSSLAETSAAFKPGASASGPWTDEMLKPSGKLVRDYIVSKAK